MFWSFKLSCDVDILAFLVWQLLWVLFTKIGQFFSFLVLIGTKSNQQVCEYQILEK